MEKEEDIASLIKSLSKSEKRYFKLFVSKNSIGESSNYLKLFDLIDKAGTADKKIIQKLCGDNIFMQKKYPVYKHLLYKQILKSLNFYNMGRSVNDKILELLKQAEILFDKNLYPQAEKALNKAEELCKKYEKYTYYMEVIRWKKKIVSTSSIYSKIDKADLSHLYEEEKTINELVNNQNEYWYLKELMYFHYKTYGIIRQKEDIEKYNSLITHPYLVKKELATSYESKLYFFNTYYTYCFIIGDLNGAYYYAKERVDFIEAHLHQQEAQPINYVMALHNLLFATKQLKKYKEFHQMLPKFKMMIKKDNYTTNENLQRILRLMLYNLEFAFYINIGDVKKATQFLPEIETFIKEKQVNNEVIIFFIIYYMAILYFIKGELNEALNKINIILNDNKIYIRQDYHSYVRIIQMVIHFEKKNFSILPYLIKSYYRFLINKKMLYKTESIFIHFIKTKIKTISNSKEQTEALKQLRNEIEETMKDPMEARLTGAFDIISWLESKITNRPFEEIVREKSGFYV